MPGSSYRAVSGFSPVSSHISSATHLVGDPSICGAPRWVADLSQSPLVAPLALTRGSSGSRFLANGTLETLGNDQPRFDAHPTTQKNRGILLEGGRTNFLLNSASPVGQTVPLANGTYCLWVVGTGSATVAAGTAVGSGFGTAAAGTPVVFTVTTGGTVLVGVAGSLSRFQLENNPFPTSCITTFGTATTRADDVLKAADISLFSFNPQEGTVVVEFESQGGVSEDQFLLQLFSASGNDTASMVIPNWAYGLQIQFGGMASNVCALVAGTRYTCAFAYKAGDSAAYLQGASMGGNLAGASMPTTLAGLYVGRGLSWGQYRRFFGWVGKVTYYPFRLPNSALQALTV